MSVVGDENTLTELQYSKINHKNAAILCHDAEYYHFEEQFSYTKILTTQVPRVAGSSTGVRPTVFVLRLSI